MSINIVVKLLSESLTMIPNDVTVMNRAELAIVNVAILGDYAKSGVNYSVSCFVETHGK